MQKTIKKIHRSEQCRSIVSHKKFIRDAYAGFSDNLLKFSVSHFFTDESWSSIVCIKAIGSK